jgi:glycosyltransferase involved in cell wall biosynthesis
MNSNICYCLPRYRDAANSALQLKFPGVTFEIRPMSELREQGAFKLIRRFRSYNQAVFFAYDLDVQRMLIGYVLVLLWFSRRGVYFMDMQGKIEKVEWSSLFFHYLPAFLVEIASVPCLLWKIKRVVSRLFKNTDRPFKKRVLKSGSLKLAYLRTDLTFGVTAGGSVGHIAGVVNGFIERGAKVFIISADKLELIDGQNTPLCLVKPGAKYNSLAEIPELYYNEVLFKEACIIFEKEKPNLIYQRYSLNNFTGVALAREFKLPFILEYNGSEVWVAKNWGRRLHFERLSSRIEMLNFRAADLITVVSKPLKDELEGRGVPERKILVNPNGVDPQRYRPDINGSNIKKKYGLEGKTIIGFIGTFGNWHGAEVLAEAAVKLIKELKMPADAHFLFIGDGVKLPETKRIIGKGGIEERVTFTGLVPQEQGPEYLAACDVLVAPHVPNPDGSPFFGSPTKLFEYMAMGKGIVASNLDQIGEVLEHEKTAWLVPPGNIDGLAEGILALVRDKELRDGLGRNARSEVIEKYTWKQHVARTMAKLTEVLKREAD